MPGIAVLIVMGVLSLVILLTGYRLRKKGLPAERPYPGLLLNFHKLLALGTAVWLMIILFGKENSLSLNPLQELIRAAAVVLAAAAVVSGGVRSIPKPIPSWIGTVHKIMPYLALASGGFLLFVVLIL